MSESGHSAEVFRQRRAITTSALLVLLLFMGPADLGLSAPSFSSVAQADQPSPAAQLEKADELSDESLRKLVEQLGDPSFVRREQAQERLESYGHHLLGRLIPFRDHRDVEIASRIAAVFEANIWTKRGALIFRLEPGSQAVDLGLNAGDVVLRIEDIDVASINEIRMVPDTQRRELIVLNTEGMRTVTVAPGRIGIWLSSWEEEVGGMEQLRAIKLLDDSARWPEARRLLQAVHDRGVNDLWTTAALSGLAASELDHAAALRLWQPMARTRSRAMGWEDVQDHIDRGLPLGSVALAHALAVHRDAPDQPAAQDELLALATFVEPNLRLIDQVGSRLPRDPATGNPTRVFTADAGRAWVRIAAFRGDYREAMDLYRNYAGGTHELAADAMLVALKQDPVFAQSLAMMFREQVLRGVQDAPERPYGLYAFALTAMDQQRIGIVPGLPNTYRPSDIDLSLNARPLAVWQQAVGTPIADLLRLPAVARHSEQLVAQLVQPRADQAQDNAARSLALQLLAANPQLRLTEPIAQFLEQVDRNLDQLSASDLDARLVLAFRLEQWELMQQWIRDLKPSEAIATELKTRLEAVRSLGRSDTVDAALTQGVIDVIADTDDGSTWALRWDGSLLHVRADQAPAGITTITPSSPWRASLTASVIRAAQGGVLLWHSDQPGEPVRFVDAADGTHRIARPDDLDDKLTHSGMIAAVLARHAVHAGRLGAEQQTPRLLCLRERAHGWWWTRWEDDLAVAVHPESRRTVVIHEAVRQQIGGDSPAVFGPSRIELDPQSLWVPTAQGLWRFDLTTAELTRIDLNQQADRQPLRILNWPNRADTVFVGVCPSVSGSIFALTRQGSDWKVEATGGFCGQGPNDVFHDLREVLYHQQKLEVIRGGADADQAGRR